MLSASEEGLVAARAYVPEHLPGYVGSIARAEPFLLQDYLSYRAGSSLIFIGFPLGSSFREETLSAALDSALARFTPREVALVAPALPRSLESGQGVERDRYYRLALAGLALPGKVRNMIRRASRDIEVEVGRTMTPEHERLIAEFLDGRRLGEQVRFIYERIPAYVASMPTALVLSARTRTGLLVAFDVAEFGAQDYAFYQFNVRSRRACVPGASDVLLHEIVAAAQKREKRYVNLGLGISPGVARFKAGWGGQPFLDYAYCRYRPGRRGLLDMLVGGI